MGGHWGVIGTRQGSGPREKGVAASMGNWSLRRAEPRDAEALSACIEAAYADYAARIPDLPPVSADCAGDIARHQVWLAEIAGAVAGGLVLVPRDGFMQLANLAVHPDRKGAGLGRALLAHADAEASAQGYRELRLTTHADMPETHRFYARLGWQETARSGNKVSMRKAI